MYELQMGLIDNFEFTEYDILENDLVSLINRENNKMYIIRNKVAVTFINKVKNKTFTKGICKFEYGKGTNKQGKPVTWYYLKEVVLQ